jgi:DMSO reductase family type II enzyme heme b subunit
MKKRILLSMICILLIMSAGTVSASDNKGIQVHYVEQALDLNTAADVWNEAEPFAIELVALESLDHMGATHSTDTLPREFIRSIPEKTDFVLNLSKDAPSVIVKAVHNGSKVAFQFTWADSTEDKENSLNTYRDALAVLFPVGISSGYNPSPLMGAKGEPVNVWQWRAEWQAELDGRRDLEARQPLTEGVWISPTDRILKNQQPGMSSGLINTSERIEYIAEGYSTLTKQVQQDVDAKGRYADGKYTVVFLRDIERTDLSDAEFKAGSQTYINVAVWNGHEGNVDGMKSLTFSWTRIEFDPAPALAKR